MKYLLPLVLCVPWLLPPGRVDAASSTACSTFGENAAKYRTSDLLSKMREECAQDTGSDGGAAAFGTKDEVAVLWPRLMVDPDATPQFVAAINDQTAPLNFRLVLISVAGQTRIPDVMSALENLAESDPNVMVRREAISALGQTGLPDVFETLVDSWASESDNEARSRVILSLGVIGNKTVWEDLHAGLAAQWAKTPLDPLTSSGALGPVLTPAQETQLRALFANALDDQSYVVRIAAADAIAQRHYLSMARLLARNLAKETPTYRTPSSGSPGIYIENKMVKVRLLSAIRRLRASSQEKALIAYLPGEQDPDVVATALDVLGSIGSAASANTILNALDSADDFVAMHAAMAAASLKQTAFAAYIHQRISTAQDSFAIQKMTEAASALAN